MTEQVTAAKPRPKVDFLYIDVPLSPSGTQPQSLLLESLQSEVVTLTERILSMEKELQVSKLAAPLLTGNIIVAILTAFTGFLSFYSSFAGDMNLAWLFFVPFLVGIIGTIALWLTSYWR